MARFSDDYYKLNIVFLRHKGENREAFALGVLAARHIVVTAAHAVKHLRAENLTVHRESGYYGDVQLIDPHKSEDIAILELVNYMKNDGQSPAPVEFASIRTVGRAYVFGRIIKDDVTETLQRHEIAIGGEAHVDNSRDGISGVQASGFGQVLPGFSGSPIVCQESDLIIAIQSQIFADDNLSRTYCAWVAPANDLLNKHGVPVRVVSSVSKPPHLSSIEPTLAGVTLPLLRSQHPSPPPTPSPMYPTATISTAPTSTAHPQPPTTTNIVSILEPKHAPPVRNHLFRLLKVVALVVLSLLSVAVAAFAWDWYNALNSLRSE